MAVAQGSGRRTEVHTSVVRTVGQLKVLGTVVLLFAILVMDNLVAAAAESHNHEVLS